MIDPVHEQRREALFADMVEEHGAALARVCGGYERDEIRRKDLLEEVLLNAWRALRQYRGDASLRTWLFRIAHNVASRHISREVRQPTVAADEPNDEHAGGAEQRAVPGSR